MKTYLKSGFLVLILMLCFTINGFSQADSTIYKVKIEQYQRMQRTGSVIAIAGGVLCAAGIGMFMMTGRNDDFLIPASVATGVGLATIIPGFILRSNGKRKEAEYRIKLNDIRASFYYTPRHSGIVLAYRF